LAEEFTMEGKFFSAVCAVCVFLFSSFAAQAQSILPQGAAPDVYRIVEKHNFRKRLNGKYQGAAYREIRGTLQRVAGASAGGPGGSAGLTYDGRFFILEETKRAAQLAGARVDESLPVSLRLSALGAVMAGSPGRFPTMRDFPALPQKAIVPGTQWEAGAERILDPDFSGKITAARVQVEYHYTGPGEYKGFPGHNLTAKYAVRYRRGQGASADPDLDEVMGGHEANIFLPSGAEGPRLISETFHEEYRYRDGRVVALEGTVLILFEGVAPLDQTETIGRIAGVITQAAPSLTLSTEAPPSGSSSASSGGGSSAPPPPAPREMSRQNPPPGPPQGTSRELPDIEVAPRPEGVALTINNLRFKADSAELLASEEARLEALAKALSSIPAGRNFLIVGHTADMGRPSGEKQLSVERAGAIAAALEKRGISKDRLLTEGRGGTQPLAPNTNEAGRARNRRVEAIILN
jgi:outer membrane protein OmpA-like peptidoglycan-associated protein